MQHIGKSVAIFGCAESRFLQMREDGNVGILDDAAVNPKKLESWRTWERFLVVDAGHGKIALHNAHHNRFLRIYGENVDAQGGVCESSKLPSNWDSERFSVIDAGNGKVAFHNAKHNRFMRVCSNEVDAKGGVKDVGSLPPESEWGSERFIIVPHPLSQEEKTSGGGSAGAMELPPDYENKGKIASGWWGTTYRGLHKFDDNLYCVKHIHHDRHKYWKDLKLEMRNLTRLPYHENIVRYHHSTVFKDQLFIVTELVLGHQLLDEVPAPQGSSKRTFSSDRVLAWTRQLFEGLKHLHGGVHTIVHRDLHLGNILVRLKPGKMYGDTSPGSIKIIDVGMAKILDDHELHAMTYRGGTFQYFSPERRSGNPFNEKDDIWAVGCLIVELVIGKFISTRSGCGASGVDFAMTPAKVAAVVAEVEEVSARCGRLVKAILLQRDPSTRPTAAQLLQRSEFW